MPDGFTPYNAWAPYREAKTKLGHSIHFKKIFKKFGF